MAFEGYEDGGNYLNYTEAKILLAKDKVDANLAPRQQLCGSNIFYKVPTSTTKLKLSTCVGAIDTAREKQIGLGAEYPFDPLGPGECLVPIDL